MQVSNTVALVIIVLVVVGLLCVGDVLKRRNEQFTRTCLTADTNCKFVRQQVDYVSQEDQGLKRTPTQDPHYMADPTDKAQRLQQGHIDLIKDETRLINGSLWKQYGNDYKGSGNDQAYIVNDDKTRWALKEVGDVWAARILEDQHLPEHGGPFEPAHKNYALTDMDMIEPDQFDQLYGGTWLNNMIGR
jgi:hypothetical protein